MERLYFHAWAGLGRCWDRDHKKAFWIFSFRLFVGSYFLVEYYEPGVLTLPLLPFLVGGIIGANYHGTFTEWALIVISCLVGAYFVTSVFSLSYIAEILLGSGLFIIGALTQVILRQMQIKEEEI